MMKRQTCCNVGTGKLVKDNEERGEYHSYTEFTRVRQRLLSCFVSREPKNLEINENVELFPNVEHGIAAREELLILAREGGKSSLKLLLFNPSTATIE